LFKTKLYNKIVLFVISHHTTLLPLSLPLQKKHNHITNVFFFKKKKKKQNQNQNPNNQTPKKKSLKG